MRPRLLSGTGFLVVLFVFLGVLWAESYRAEHHVWVNLPAGRYTLRLTDGRLTVWGPPAEDVPVFEKQVAQLATQLRNDQIDWCGPLIVGDRNMPRFESVPVDAEAGTPAGALMALLDTPASRPLLKALDDPSRIGAAHAVLMHLAYQFTIRTAYMRSYSAAARARMVAMGRSATIRPLRPLPLLRSPRPIAFAGDKHGQIDASGRLAPHTLVTDCNGLKVELWPEGAVAKYSQYPARLVAAKGAPGANFFIDPSCFESVRDAWHRQLDSRVVSAPLWPLILAALVLPLVRGVRLLRSHESLRRGLCPRCGYDLRASKERCPECGYTIPPPERRVPRAGLRWYVLACRGLFVVGLAGSLLLLLSILTLWGASRGGVASVHWARNGRLYWIGCDHGQMFLELADAWPSDEPLVWSGPADRRVPQIISYAGPYRRPADPFYARQQTAAVPFTPDHKASWAVPGPWTGFNPVDEVMSTWRMYGAPIIIASLLAALPPFIFLVLLIRWRVRRRIENSRVAAMAEHPRIV